MTVALLQEVEWDRKSPYNQAIAASFSCKAKMQLGPVAVFFNIPLPFWDPSYCDNHWVPVDPPQNVDIRPESHMASMGQAFTFNKSPVAG